MRRDSPRDPPEGTPPEDPGGQDPDSEGPETDGSVPTRPRPRLVVSEPSLPPEDPLVLDEIDRIISELQTRRENGTSHSSPSPWTMPYSTGATGFPTEDGGGHAGAPSGYFEEHLEAARTAVGRIDEQVGDLETTSASLRQRVAAAESELDRIRSEYYFVRNNGNNGVPSTGNGAPSPPWSEDGLTGSRASAGPEEPGLTSGSFTAIRAASAASEGAVYEGFGVDRYNRTIDSVKAGRARLVILTLGLSALIGIVLLVLVLYSPIVNPPIWVAILPLVWIIPIPYFLLSFRGTQRVLTRNHLNLPEAK